MKKVKIFRIIPVFLILIMVIGTVPVSAAKKKKPGKATITAEVTKVLPEWVEITVKIEKTDNADGYDIYRKVTGQSKYMHTRTLNENGDDERQVVITCGFDVKNVAIRVRAFNSSGYGKYSNVVKIKVSDYNGKEVKTGR